MLRRVFGMALLLSMTLEAMGPSINYDDKFDQEAQASIKKEVKEDLSQRLSMLTLKSLILQEKYVNQNGKSIKKNIPVKKVSKGSKVVYINRLINNDSRAKIDIVVKNPIPLGTSYIIGSATCNGGCIISFSSDGGATFSTEEEEGQNYTDLEFHFKKIASKKEMRMGFGAIIK